MGQVSSCHSCNDREVSSRSQKRDSFPDLAQLPPEVAVEVLSHLDATDLCLASCVNDLWCSLTNVDVLWKRLCYRRWEQVSAYYNGYMDAHTYKSLYLTLDNGMLTFSSDPHEGLRYLIQEGVLNDDSESIAAFIHYSDIISWPSLEKYLRERWDVLEKIVSLHNYENHFLPDALRYLFSKIPAPKERGPFLDRLLDLFLIQYKSCNVGLSYSTDTLKVLCYSLILLSVDLTSPHVKNKMSKREFIRNLRPTVTGISDDTLGHMYDNIYLSGHVATQDDTGSPVR
ncbi:PREDICTED: F-box only protein 8-like isoform X1 [Amphimedon queenslandica]|uniref:SEC7 domain-containing protein n=1 Tax=Amphimedon queenslandica TaxID=400682 RepID=A0A1X7UDN5_AMPQE|nr:PREDICTED: F-box only protein 8-like isoform X1 [Amphimedon queenslandica]|eukprot:XP_019854895.1 PREDICTED: F-box only protein 8-like isoform X1 [Amphimedon queenslandica]